MVKQPSVIIIARHGARLDAADKAWHLSTPTPYDPPITYGGWNQSRALGLRIAALLHAREQSLNDLAERASSIPREDLAPSPDPASTANTTNDGSAKKSRKRKHKVYIHSSPFQRCVQTSIGISAGLAQFQVSAPNGPTTANRPRSDSKTKTARGMHSASPRLRAADASKSPSLMSISEPIDDFRRNAFQRGMKDHGQPVKATLRIDAFLGEWLSPDYFDQITPPPNSTMMVGGAKAELLRGGDMPEAFAPSTTAKAPQGSLWGAAKGVGPSGGAEGSLDNWKSMSQALPRRDRTSSYSGSQNSSTIRHSSPLRPQSSHAENGSKAELINSSSYAPPTPTYAISPAEPIPKGYVAHARDACVGFDHQWDSMREPLSWGDGGEYGEEWSAMHKRFRSGFQHLVEYYNDQSIHEQDDDHEAVSEATAGHEDDEDTDTVVVMVTHGAGCNALIGALTDQPVLLDVGTASLTMAVRKPDGPPVISKPESPSLDTRSQSPRSNGLLRRGSVNLGMSLIYDMKIIASSEHLRPGVDPSRPAAPVASTSMSAAQTVPESRRRMASLSSHASSGSPLDATWNIGEPSRQGNSMSSALGSIRRSSAANLPSLRNGSASSVARSSFGSTDGAPVPSPSGLWTPNTPPLLESEFEAVPKARPDHDLAIDLSNLHLKPGSTDASAQSSNTASYTSNTRDAPAQMKDKPLSNRPTSIPAIDGTSVETSDSVSALPKVGSQIPTSLGRTLSQKGLWGSAPKGEVSRDRGPKRRWSVQQE